LTAAYVLLAAAEIDLRDIIRYTRGKWGIARAWASGIAAVRDMHALDPGLRMMRCQHHFIFWLPRDNAPALLVAIFPENMDLMTRIANRLR